MQIKETQREFDDNGKQELVLDLVASEEDVNKSFKEYFDQLQTRELKGFRKGKAPREVLEQSVGGHANAMAAVAETLVNNIAIPEIDQAGIIFIEEPEINIDGLIEEGKPFVFSISGAVAPEMKLTNYDPIAIELPPEEATDEDVEAQLDALRDFYHSFETIKDDSHVAEMGDFVMATITVTNDDDKVVNGLSAKSRMIGLGKGMMPPSFDEHIVGAKAGDTLEFDFDATSEDGSNEFGDGNLHAVVDVKNFRREILPEVNDEFAGKVGCVNVEDMMKTIRTNINTQKKNEIPKLKIDRIMDQLIERLDGEVPEYYVDFIRQDVGRELMQDLEKKGTNLQEWMLQNSVQSDAMKEDIQKESERRAAIDCALEAVFAAQNLQLEDADIDRIFEGDDDTETTKAAWIEQNRYADILKMARQTKATEWLSDNADVTIVK